MTRFVCCMFALMALVPPAYAERWFEVEILVFLQPEDESLTERFKVVDSMAEVPNTTPLFVNAVKESLTNACLNATSQSVSPRCDDPELLYTEAEQVPTRLNVEGQEHQYAMHVLSPDQLQFTEQSKKLRWQRRDLLLHTGWRFPERVSKEMTPVRLIAGNNYADQYDALGIKREGLMSEINQPSPLALFDGLTRQDATRPAPLLDYQAPLWQVDGTLGIYVEHYLYIDSRLYLRLENLEQNTLDTIEFKQFKRVISKEIHYFDHPKIGMVLQVRRYNH